MQPFFTAWNWLFRSLKKGDWIWLMFAIVLASLSVTTIDLLAKSVKQSMLTEAANQLGADLVIKHTRPIDAQWKARAKTLNLEVAEVQSLVTMLAHEDDFQLIQLKAISNNYPLRGEKAYSNVLDADSAAIESDLLNKMGLQLQQNITLGKAKFTLASQFTPKRLSGGMDLFAQQVLIPIQALKTTNLLGPGSRSQYELSFSGNDADIQTLYTELKAAPPEGMQILTAKSPSQDLAQSLDTAWLFLDLSALAAILVAGLAILIASRFYLQRWQAQIALMRALGAETRRIRLIMGSQLTFLAILASVIGIIIGHAVFLAITPFLQSIFNELVITEPFLSSLKGLMIGVLVLWAFVWQSFAIASKTSALFLFKNPDLKRQIQHWFVSLAWILLLVSLLVPNHNLPWILTGLIAISTLFYLAAALLLNSIKTSQKYSNGWLKIALSALTREADLVKIQLISVGLVLFVLILLTFVRQDLMHNWQGSLPESTPDTFIMNAQIDQKEPLEKLLSQNGIQTQLTPMVRGRLIAKNTQKYDVDTLPTPRARRLLNREGNIGLMQSLPEYNEIIQTLPNSPSQGVSVEQEIAELFNIKLGDQLTFDFSGQQFTYPVTSIRSVKWQSFNLNFFFILTMPASDAEFSVSYIGNFKMPDSTNKVTLLRSVEQTTPGVMLINVKNVIEQVKSIMDQAAWAVTGLYLFTLFSSVIVLLTAVRASQTARIQSWLLLKTLGAKLRTIQKIGLAEFVLLGSLAGVFAAVFAQISSLLISTHLLKLSPSLNIELWMISVILGISFFVTAGWLTQKGFIRQTVNQLKRQLGSH